MSQTQMKQQSSAGSSTQNCNSNLRLRQRHFQFPRPWESPVTDGVRETQPVRIFSATLTALDLGAFVTGGSNKLALVVMSNGDSRYGQLLGGNFCLQG